MSLISDQVFQDSYNYAMSKVCQEAGYDAKEVEEPDWNDPTGKKKITSVKCAHTEKTCLDTHWYQTDVTPKKERDGEYPIFPGEPMYGEWNGDMCIAADYAFKTMVKQQKLQYVPDRVSGVGVGIITPSYCGQRCLGYNKCGTKDNFVYDAQYQCGSCPNKYTINNQTQCYPDCFEPSGKRAASLFLGDTLTTGIGAGLGECPGMRKCGECNYNEYCKAGMNCVPKLLPGDYCVDDGQCRNFQPCYALQNCCKDGKSLCKEKDKGGITDNQCLNCCIAKDFIWDKEAQKCDSMTTPSLRLKCEEEACARNGKCLQGHCTYYDRVDRQWLYPDDTECDAIGGVAQKVTQAGKDVFEKGDVSQIYKLHPVGLAADTVYTAVSSDNKCGYYYDNISYEYSETGKATRKKAPITYSSTQAGIPIPDRSKRKRLICRGSPMKFKDVEKDPAGYIKSALGIPRCRPAGDVGDQCMKSNQCLPGLYCNSRGSCAFKKKEGEECINPWTVIPTPHDEACQSPHGCAGGAYRCYDMDGKLPNGTYCVAGQNQCKDTSYCKAFSGGKLAQCVEKGSLGADCWADGECKSGSCKMTNSSGLLVLPGKCSVKLKEGDRCDFGLGGACPEGTTCIAFSNTCQRGTKDGSAVIPGLITCLSSSQCDYDCSSGQCTGPDGKLFTGNVCAGDHQCRSPDVCRFTKGMRRCAPPGGNNSSCDWAGSGDKDCRDDLICQYGTCQPRGGIGEACFRTKDCKDGYFCGAGTCGKWGTLEEKIQTVVTQPVGFIGGVAEGAVRGVGSLFM